jgi:hypothetical protein
MLAHQANPLNTAYTIGSVRPPMVATTHFQLPERGSAWAERAEAGRKQLLLAILHPASRQYNTYIATTIFSLFNLCCLLPGDILYFILFYSKLTRCRGRGKGRIVVVTGPEAEVEDREE